MTGAQENERCYFCGGRVSPDFATIPFVVGKSVIVVKQVPAYVCSQCGEAIMDSEVAQTVDQLLKRAWQSGFEVSIITYSALEPAVP
jgi:YgiT-type zinc finger domain-containing protein